MSSETFSLIRVFLSKLGLSKEAVDDVVDLIGDFLGSKEEKEKPQAKPEFPYHLCDMLRNRCAACPGITVRLRPDFATCVIVFFPTLRSSFTM
jgi:hypothetical protein